MLVLFDLDGFKHYNDTFGHPAGDALLVRLGAGLADFVEGRGTAYRMGGDEFCALLRPGSRSAMPLVAGAAAALSEHGDGFAIGCSYGAIHLPAEAAEAAEALRIADQRMYAQKNAGRTSATRQSKDVLLRALAERNPDLRHELAADGRISPRRPPASSACRPTRSSRSATPPSCATSARWRCRTRSSPSRGRSDDDEWVFIRRHTLIGERIIAAAPALTRVAGLVRSSHERWDGAGYPDALDGEHIPLGARIVAVADAFTAMTERASVRGAPLRRGRPGRARGAVPGRSSTPQSSPPSPSPTATSASPPRHSPAGSAKRNQSFA